MELTEVRFPPKFDFLFQPAPYKVAHGGRGGAKSWSYARALLLLGGQKPLRVLWTREVQRSIKDSVHKLLCDQIQILGLGQFYSPTLTEIRGKNGSEFIFAGLADHTVESIKSYEGVDIVWVEEAQVVSKRSWDILIPTIRKPGSEIWVSFNPALDTDDTWTRFVENPPPGACVVQVNYSDNPWFSAESEAQRKHAQKTSPKDYSNIWEGKCKAAVDGAIYADEVAALQNQGRITFVPYEPKLKVHVAFDLGWNDKMAIILAQRQTSELRIIEYIEDSHKTLDWYSATLKERKYNWGQLWLPHDGEHKDYKYGRSAEEIMRNDHGWDVRIIPRADVESGIKAARSALGRAYFDKGKTGRLIECLKRYRRTVPRSTDEPSVPMHDEWSHGADAFRYLASIAERMGNDESMPKIKYPEDRSYA